MLDADTLPQQPVEAVADGCPVDLLVGCTSEEANLYLVPTGALSRVTEADVDSLARRLGVPAVELKAANRRDPADGPAQILARATTDALFAGATRRLADAAARRSKTFCYEFAWRSDAFAGDLGACHCGDLPWIFRTTGVPALNGSQSLLGTNRPDTAHVRRIHEAWAGFVRTATRAGLSTAPGRLTWSSSGDRWGIRRVR